MEVAVPEEPQKKIFRARKTMKMSDRQQLEALHNTLTTSSSTSLPSSSSPTQTPLVNGSHAEKDKEKVKKNDLNHKETDLVSSAPDSSHSSPSPSLSVSVSRSSTSPNTQTISPSVKNGLEKKRDEKTKDVKGENESKDGGKNEDVKVDSKEACKSEHSSSSATLSKKGDINKAETEKMRDCDPEVKEGFLCLSEEDDVQAEKDDKKDQSEEKMIVDTMKEDQKDERGTSENTGEDNSASAGTKRSLSEENDDDKEIKNVRDGKRARLDGEELEAQLELKITANGGSRHKLEKMVQQLVEERLRELQLTVFDHSIKELKDRVEKIDSATKQQNALHHITTLQAKIARLAKKFGAANQASENLKTYSVSTAAQPNTTNMIQTASQRTVRTTMDPKLSSPGTGSANSTAIPAQPKPLSTPTTQTSSALASTAPILQIISSSTSSTPSSTSLTGQSQTGTLLLKTGPNTGVMTANPASSGGQSVSIQPLLIQLPLAMANGQSGALVNTAGGVGLIPVSSLSTVNSINKAKTTTPATTFILQKAVGSVASSSSVSSTPVMSLARAVYPGGTGTVSSPSTGISVTSARTPAQCAAVVGVSTTASSPGTTGPAATGSAPAAAGPPSASALASKTEFVEELRKSSDEQNLQSSKPDMLLPDEMSDSTPEWNEDDDFGKDLQRPLLAEPSTSSASPTAALDERKEGGRGGGRRTQPVVFPDIAEARWHTLDEADIPPPETDFRPSRTPGPHLNTTKSYSPLELFQLFFSSEVCQTIVRNSNAYAAEHQDTTRKPLQDMSLKDLYSYLSLIIFMGLLKVPVLTDYWNGSRLYRICFPATVMSCRKFQAISSALHLSDPKVDAKNMKKKGTPAYDRLGKLKPVYQEIQDACKTYYQPYQNVAINERMVASKARIVENHKDEKPTNWGYKLFVLADSFHAYTWNFFIQEDKSPAAQSKQSKGLSCESVMALFDDQILGRGYKLYLDNLYTSPSLFRDLCQKGIWACGTIRSNQLGFPPTTTSSHGSVQWIRENELLFVEWKDTRKVLMCSSFHSANGDHTVQSRVKKRDGEKMEVTVPIPSVVSDYNKNMGGVDASNALIGYYTVLQKTRKWYRSLFYHFVDIAVVNAFILHQQMAAFQDKKTKTQREFREELVLELADWMPQNEMAPVAPDPYVTEGHSGHACHRAKYIAESRRRCKVCRLKTSVLCCACDVYLCFQATRDCFNNWHDEHNLWFSTEKLKNY